MAIRWLNAALDRFWRLAEPLRDDDPVWAELGEALIVQGRALDHLAERFGENDAGGSMPPGGCH